MERARYDKKITDWIEDVEQSGCTVKKISTLQEIRRRKGDLLFALLDVDVVSPDGVKLPHIVFIRGHACVIIPLLINQDTGEERYLMVRQWRIGNGQFSLEFPAGMLDHNTEDPPGVAVRELQEETGLLISKDELFPLTDKVLYSSAGGSDEGIYFFGCVKSVGTTLFESFRKGTGGNPEEGEQISFVLLSRDEAEPHTSSLQARLGFFLFESYRRKSP